MTVGTMCTRLPGSTEPTDSVERAAEQMLQQDIGTLVIMDDDRRPVGIVTDRDLVTRCVAMGLSPRDTEVGGVMTTQVHSVHEDEAVEVALEVMADEEVRRLVVLNDAGRVVGIVSLDDFLEGIVEATEEVGRLLRAQVHV